MGAGWILYKMTNEICPKCNQDVSGKTTLKGEYPKLNNDSNCKFPDRLSCNSGVGFRRCEFMEYGGSLGNWKCTYEN